MKKNLVCGLLFLFPAALMVLRGPNSVNVPAIALSLITPTTSAKGNPMPNPRGPHASATGLLAAEGDPMPGPGGPHASGAGLLAAEGDPMPGPGGPHAATLA
jgi:hypothetical protein